MCQSRASRGLTLFLPSRPFPARVNNSTGVADIRAHWDSKHSKLPFDEAKVGGAAQAESSVTRSLKSARFRCQPLQPAKCDFNACACNAISWFLKVCFLKCNLHRYATYTEAFNVNKLATKEAVAGRQEKKQEIGRVSKRI
jgi:hypothetical protein